ncbi:hypothetical protein LY90DRAFT_705889 [Neocallimastix californiae]|uniref:N-acetyltransferase domain-containing protein n=1 Tax=Neocallimastix californiae TaxID=1754190 RepID=A0A1Y2B0D1_9FUNG|nr:hypothetical protein LY90DRAFT_705889 [Neocallimastix californiae]|eukprot:ORY27545.1 hypothetical protein LY90DRAFT_705889 [Neocallimastix californiae]
MNENYIFRKIKKEEVPIMFGLILDRMEWMNENNIKQWNVHGYDTLFPLSFYEKECKNGNLYVLVDATTNELVSGAVLLEIDDRWNDNEPSLYLHNYVSKIGKSGVGKIFMKHAEEYAKSKGKKYFRLDSAEDNEKLTKYYEKQGFKPAGKCSVGPYIGVLRQKEI